LETIVCNSEGLRRGGDTTNTQNAKRPSCLPQTRIFAQTVFPLGRGIRREVPSFYTSLHHPRARACRAAARRPSSGRSGSGFAGDL